MLKTPFTLPMDIERAREALDDAGSFVADMDLFLADADGSDPVELAARAHDLGGRLLDATRTLALVTLLAHERCAVIERDAAAVAAARGLREALPRARAARS